MHYKVLVFSTPVSWSVLKSVKPKECNNPTIEAHFSTQNATFVTGHNVRGLGKCWR